MTPPSSPADRSFRSVLYIPGSKPRAIEKARGLPVDAIILDLEDAVAPDEKPAARDIVREELAKGGFGPRYVLVRINGADTGWGTDDLAAIAPAEPAAILLPKVDGRDMMEAAASSLTGETALWAMMETPAGILHAPNILRAERAGGLVLGTNDLAKDLHCDPGADRMPLLASLQACLLAARAAGLPCIDGVYNAFKDDDGLRVECEQGRRLGMDGKTLIHPAQVAIANAAFAPSPEAVELARRQIAAYEAAVAAGQGVAVLDGQIVENLHVDTARRTLAKLDAIAKLEG